MRYLFAPVLIASVLLTAEPAVASDRSEFVTAAIDEFNEKLSQADRDRKYRVMASSVFAFYRGTNHLFWADFETDSRKSTFAVSPNWVQGDLHAYNMGSLEDADNEVMYNVNQFDECLVADYQSDVWRMATSIVLIARLNGDLSEDQLEEVVEDFADAYLKTFESYVGNDDELKVYFDEHNTHSRIRDFLKEARDKEADDARKDLLDEWTYIDDNGDRRFKSRAETQGRLERTRAAERMFMDQYGLTFGNYGRTLSGNIRWDPMYFTFKDLARRHSTDVGLIGTPRGP